MPAFYEATYSDKGVLVLAKAMALGRPYFFVVT